MAGIIFLMVIGAVLQGTFIAVEHKEKQQTIWKSVTLKKDRANA